MPAWAITLGISAGGMALQYLLAPRQKQVPVDKGKFDDIRIQGSDYGAFIPRAWGKARFAGNLVFSSGIDHTIVNTPSDGGKGGPSSPSERTHIYKSDLGVLLCRKTVNNFIRIWGDADILAENGTGLYSGTFEAEDATLTGGASSYIDATASGGEAVENLGNGGIATFATSTVPNPPLPRHDPDEVTILKTRLSFFYKSASDLTVTIDTEDISPEDHVFPSSASDWTTYTTIVVGGANTVTYQYAAAACPDLDKIFIEKFWEVTTVEPRSVYQITGAVNPDIAYPTNVNDPSEYYNYDPELAKSGTGIYTLATAIPGEVIRYYTGTETQTADSIIQSWLDGRYGVGEGTLRASAMRGLSYVIFEAFALKNGRVPNFTVELDANNEDVNDILPDLFADVNLDSGDYDFTATAGLTQVGFLESAPASRKQLCELLARYHFFRFAEIDGEIKTIVDTGASSVTFSADKLRAHDYGEEMPAYDAEVMLKEDHLLPREVRVSVMNPDAEYHNETATAQLFSDIVGTESKEYTFPIIDTIDNARTVAEKLLLKEYYENTAYEFWAMPEYAQYSIGDVITVPINGVNYVMRIEKKRTTLPTGKVQFQCVSTGYIYSGVVFQDDATALAPKAELQYANKMFPRNSVVWAFHSQPVTEKDKGKLGVYLAISGRGRGAGENCTLYREMAADNYVAQAIIDSPTPLGICDGTLATWATPASEDTTNSLDIWFFNDVELETVTAPDIARNPLVNLMRIGNEWVQFRTVAAQTLEDNSPYRSKWRISNLMRGLFDTTAEIGTHGADEYAALATQSMRFYELEPADLGEDVRLKAVTAGQNIEVAPITAITFNPVSLYTVTNATFDRTFDANATSVNELADVVATMIDDLNL